MQKSVCEPVELINMKESVCESVELGDMNDNVCKCGEPGGVQESVCECGRLVTCKSVFESNEFLTTRASRARWRACDSGERRYTQESVWEYWKYGRKSAEFAKNSVGIL